MKIRNLKPKLVLESLMGDPVLSHWIGPEGIAAGTALGRISTYNFNVNKHSNTPNNTNNPIDRADYSQNNDSNHEITYIKIDSNPIDIESNLIDQHNTNTTHKHSDNTILNNKTEQEDGRYTVFATFSDEPVYSVFINDNSLICLIGTNYLMIYDILNYKVLNQFPLHLTSSIIKGYKQILQDNNFVLISSVKGIVIINLENNEIHLLNNKLIINNNILSFKYPLICTASFSYENKNEKLINVYKLHLQKETLYNRMTHLNTTNTYVDSIEMLNEIVIKEKKYHLITVCKLWNNFIIVVCDLLTIILYNREDNSLHKLKTIRDDILSINSEFSDYFILLAKNSTLNLMNANLDILHTFNLYPSTFELGWSYNVVSYRNMISYNSDEGIYYMKLPDDLART